MKKTVGYYHIVLSLGKLSISEEVTLAASGLIYASDPVYTTPSITQIQLVALANAVQTDLGTRINSPNPHFTATEQNDVNALSRAIMTIKSEVEIAANKYAQGNRALFETVVRRIGFNPVGPRTKHVRIVAFMASEKGSFHFVVPSETKGALYIYQVGVTTAEGTSPTTWQTIPLDHSEFVMSGFASGTIIGLHYAVQKSPSHRKLKTAAAAEVAKIAVGKSVVPSGVLNILPVNKQGKVTLMQGVNYWHFSNIMYFRIP